MKTTLELPDDLLRRTKATAALRGASMKELITEALQTYLGDSPAQGGAEEVGWRAVFGKADGDDVAGVDAALADEFERVDPDAWR